MEIEAVVELQEPLLVAGSLFNMQREFHPSICRTLYIAAKLLDKVLKLRSRDAIQNSIKRGKTTHRLNPYGEEILYDVTDLAFYCKKETNK